MAEQQSSGTPKASPQNSQNKASPSPATKKNIHEPLAYRQKELKDAMKNLTLNGKKEKEIKAVIDKKDSHVRAFEKYKNSLAIHIHESQLTQEEIRKELENYEKQITPRNELYAEYSELICTQMQVIPGVESSALTKTTRAKSPAQTRVPKADQAEQHDAGSIDSGKKKPAAKKSLAYEDPAVSSTN